MTEGIEIVHQELNRTSCTCGTPVAIHFAAQRSSAVETNSGPLFERKYRGAPRS